MTDQIKILGLTGGIGTGKSTAAAYLREKGFSHIDADQIGRDLTADGSPMLLVLNELFGPTGAYGEKGKEILHPDGSLDRKTLAALVFNDPQKKEQLDRVMFKAIINEIDIQIAIRKARNSAGILLDAPLLFEAGLDNRCDMVVLLVAEDAIRIKRVCNRDNVTEQEVRARINSQLSDEEKKKKADVIIENSGSIEELQKQMEKILRKFSKNSCN